MRQRRTTCSRRIAIALLGVVLVPVRSNAQDVTEPSLKAAFIYNLAKFTEWPRDAWSSKTFAICVVGDASVSDALERTVKDRRLEGNSISVLRPASVAAQRQCHVLYVSGVTTDQAAHVITGLQGASVLTISDLSGFTNMGGIVQFFFEHGQLRFSIGMESTKRSGLQISAKILTLAIRK